MSTKKNLLIAGNAKIDKAVLCWSITPVKSCMNCKDCAKDCYAIKSYRQYPSCKQGWDERFELTKNDLESFVESINSQLSRTKKKVVRIHCAGDFHSKEYIAAWKKIATDNPDVTFYGYSKVFGLFNEMHELNALENVNIIDSIAVDGGINFGDDQRIEELKALGYTVCPVTDGVDVKCGKTCNICHNTDKVCFRIH